MKTTDLVKPYDLNTITTPIKNINEYSNDELKKLYKSYGLYLVTEYFKKIRTYAKDNNDAPIVFIGLLDIYTKFNTVKVLPLNISLSNVKYKNMIDIDYNDPEERKKVNNKYTAISICDKTHFWIRDDFHGKVEQILDSYDENNEIKSGWVECYEELHINDVQDIEMGRATQYEIYKFIWDTLRFCDTKTLNKLIKLASNHFEIKPSTAHRPKNNKKIYKYDKNNNLIATYNNRTECIEQDGIKKSMLSLVLSGKKKTYNGYIYREE